MSNKYLNDPLVHSSSEKFGNDLLMSIEEGQKPYWKKLFSEFFPDYEHHVDNPQKNKEQVSGVDCFVYLSGDNIIGIDQKIRTTTFTDVSLEYKHLRDDKSSKPGWIEDPNYQPDYIFYHIKPLGLTYIFPTAPLKLVWKKYKEKFMTTYGLKTSRNEGWTTYFCPVPPDVLYEGMRRHYIAKL